MNEQAGTTNGHDVAKQGSEDIILEFCRSHGAPTANWLGRLSANGQRECIRQWIVRVTSPEIQGQLPAVAEELYQEHAKYPRPPLPDGLSAEEREAYLESFNKGSRHYVRRRLEEDLRYGAIEFSDIDSPKLSVKNKRYHKYHDLCDQEWQRMVEGKEAARDNFHRAILVTLLFTASALLLTSVRIAMWCAVIGTCVTTLLIWPRRGRNRIKEEGLDGFLKGISKNQ